MPDHRINVLFVHSSSELYGSDRSLLNIVKNIDKSKYRPYVILPCQGPLVAEIEALEDVHVEIFEVAVLRRKNLSIKGGLEYLRSFNRSMAFLKKYIQDNKISLVDTNTAVVFPGAIAARHCGVKNVWHIREIIKSNLENKVISWIMNHYADAIIANSSATGKALLVDQKKVRVVYNAIEEKNSGEKQAHDHLTVGMAGRINRWKGQRLFVDMAEMVHSQCPDVVFQIAGDPYTGENYLKEELQQYIYEKHLENNVFLLGQVDNMGPFYQGLDIFVLPSIQPEPFGLVVIEAMEFQLPVVATNHGGPVEIISDGEDGYLVDHTKADEMANRILTLIFNQDLRMRMGVRGQINKRERFSVPAMVAGVENVFSEVLGQN